MRIDSVMGVFRRLPAEMFGGLKKAHFGGSYFWSREAGVEGFELAPKQDSLMRDNDQGKNHIFVK